MWAWSFRSLSIIFKFIKILFCFWRAGSGLLVLVFYSVDFLSCINLHPSIPAIWIKNLSCGETLGFYLIIRKSTKEHAVGEVFLNFINFRYHDLSLFSRITRPLCSSFKFTRYSCGVFHTGSFDSDIVLIDFQVEENCHKSVFFF